MLCLLVSCSPSQAIVDQLPSGALLFRDDFSDPASGWDRVSTQDGLSDYASGSYRIWVNEPFVDLWANPGLLFDDLTMQVDATTFAGPQDNLYGMICRSDQSGERYYYFVVSSDGYYGIGKVMNGEQSLLSSDKLLPSEAIRQGRQENQLHVSCIGDRLTLSVNGYLLAEVRDAEYREGDIGLTAGSFEQPGVDIRFDNLRVQKP